jgi:hypothetical protein
MYRMWTFLTQGVNDCGYYAVDTAQTSSSAFGLVDTLSSSYALIQREIRADHGRIEPPTDVPAIPFFVQTALGKT